MGRKPKVGIHVHAWPRLVVHVRPSLMTKVKDAAIREHVTLAKLTHEALTDLLAKRQAAREEN